MGLKEITRESVNLAAQEYDRLGPDGFLSNYGLKPEREYRLILNGKSYDSKAIAGVAHKFARPDLGQLHAKDFSGGDATVRLTLERLGFTVEQDARVPSLTTGQVYSWDELGKIFGFKPG